MTNRYPASPTGDLVRIIETDSRGAMSTLRCSRDVALWRLKRRRCEMVVMDHAGKVIGRKEIAPGQHDDQRIKWIWWMEGAEKA